MVEQSGCAVLGLALKAKDQGSLNLAFASIIT